MTEPEQQPQEQQTPEKKSPWRWLKLLVILCLTIVVAGYGWVYITEYLKKQRFNNNRWKYGYTSLLNNPEYPEKNLCGYIKQQLKAYYSQHKSYPDNREGLNFLNLKGKTPLLELSDTNGFYRKDSLEYQVECVGSVAILSRRLMESESQAYIYVNKKVLPDHLLDEFKDYEAQELAPLNFVDDGIFLYSTDLVNAHRYNAKIQNQALWQNFLIGLLFVLPVITLVTLVVLWKKIFRLLTGAFQETAKRQLSFISIVASLLSVLLAFGAANSISCYDIRPMRPRDMLQYYRLWNSSGGETFDNLLNKFQERGIIQKDTADKIRQARNIQ